MRVLQILRILKIACKIIEVFLLHLLYIHLLVALYCVSKYVMIIALVMSLIPVGAIT